MIKKITFYLLSMIILLSFMTGLEAQKKGKKGKKKGKKYSLASTVPKYTFGNTLKEQEKITSAEAISHLDLLNNLMYLSGDLYQLVLKRIL